LTHIYTDNERTRFLSGLADLESRARARGECFLASSREMQTRILNELEGEAISARSSGTGKTSFFHSLKELTLIGYYTSEIGAAQELKYVHMAGSYDGDVPFEEIGRAYS
ncbi:MAG: gluconate 2-dehydrogenase subunit 3 family protein, partial [Geminicoccales bacterium]